MFLKKTFRIVASVVVTVCVLILCIVYFLQITDTSRIKRGQLEPEITYCEFPVRIEYVVGNETIVIDDVLICEYKGIQQKNLLEKINIGDSIQRIWTCKMEKHNDSIVLYSDNGITIDFSFGSADYYMGDVGINTTYPSFRVFEKQSSGITNLTFLFSPEELQQYGIEIVRCELPEPIENSFD